MELIKFETPELQAIEKSRAKQIKDTFEPMVKMLTDFEKSFNQIIEESKKGITKELTVKAKRLRLDVGRVRIETGKIKDKQKEYIKLEDKAIMGVHNILVFAVKEKEDTLKGLEDHFENLEKERIQKLQSDRAEKLSQYVEDAFERNLSGMDEDVWNAYFQTKKREYEDRIEAEKKAEEERIQREKEEAEERERIRLENEKLRKEAELKDRRNNELRPYIQFIRDYNKILSLPEDQYKKEFLEIKRGAEDHWEFERKEQIRIQKEQEEMQAELAKEKARSEKERIDREEKLRKEREESEKVLLAERKLAEEKLRKEQEEARKLAEQIRLKEEAEKKAKQEEEERIQAELNKGDADKLKDLVKDLESLKTKYQFKSAKNVKMYSDVNILIDKVISHIQK